MTQRTIEKRICSSAVKVKMAAISTAHEVVARDTACCTVSPCSESQLGLFVDSENIQPTPEIKTSQKLHGVVKPPSGPIKPVRYSIRSSCLFMADSFPLQDPQPTAPPKTKSKSESKTGYWKEFKRFRSREGWRGECEGIDFHREGIFFQRRGTSNRRAYECHP